MHSETAKYITFIDYEQGPFLLAWFNFNHIVDK